MKKKKDVWYRYVTKRLRNIKFSEYYHICCEYGDYGCDKCPLYDYCHTDGDFSHLFNRVIRFRYTYRRKDN